MAQKRRTSDDTLRMLAELYPSPKTELTFSNEYELVCAVALSAQCTDKKVNEVTPILFKEYPHFEALADAKVFHLEKIIGPINYYRTKARNLQAMGALVSEKHAGVLPRKYEELIELPGVGRKTANVVLGELGVQHTLPVDTHVFRVSRRLGLAKGKNVREVESELSDLFPSDRWRQLHHSLILHGRRVCKAQNPACSSCPLLTICDFGKKQPTAD